MDSDYIESLIPKAKSGDKSSLKYILKSFTPIIFKYSSSIYLHGYSIEDLIQEGYLYLIKAIKKYNSKEKNFFPYAYTSLKNNYNYLIRKKSRYHKELNFKEFNYFTANTSNVEEKIIHSNTKSTLYSSLKVLDKKELSILIHYYFKHLSIKDYAYKNKLSYGSCIRLKRNALLHLKHTLETNNKVQI